MLFRTIRPSFWLFLLTHIITTNVIADSINNPCGGPSALLNLVDRPSIGDNVCAVPFKQALLESGIQYQYLQQPGGNQTNFPQAELRVGLPARNEFTVIFPNYIHQSQTPRTGFAAMTAGLKHQFAYTKNWVTAVESIFTLPNGSHAFGSDGTGVALNGIANYTVSSNISLTFMLGYTSHLEGGERYSSVNPDIVLNYIINPKLYVYGEVYGQSKTASDEGSGWNADGGFLYLWRPHVAFDLELGQRIAGQLGGFNQYIGAGCSILFN